MGSKERVLVKSKFNYSKSKLVSIGLVGLFIIFWLMISYVAITNILNRAILMGLYNYEAAIAVVFLIISYFVGTFIGKKVYRKLFLKEVKIIDNGNGLTLIINGNERRIDKSEIVKIESEVTGNTTIHSNAVDEKTKLSIYSRNEAFHFSINENVESVEKVESYFND
ncbi:hypothetical protein I6N96_10870 [Enterococcus sp. BWM-S5]|uniref:DUF304 domain-containing protein n=1 Tax=Enterococcus larvae TaxID=2794352 RepID=A0ABS4CJY5_9ENTE|nr:hypothetical protein [Enterococcus larvae]MBP1046768.1 hypothetical protein [Enterococcus larvae]